MFISSLSLWGGLNLLKIPAVQESRGASSEAVLPAVDVTQGREEMELSAHPPQEPKTRHSMHVENQQ